MRIGPLRLTLTGALVWGAFIGAVEAHQHPCNHFHEPSNPNRLISCNNPDAACTQNNCGGTCKVVQTSSSAICECVIPGGGGSVSLGVYFFDDQNAGPPAPQTSPIYLATGDNDNAATVVVGGTTGFDFDNKDPFVGGTFTVVFPDFAPGEPEVVATLDNVSLSFAPVGDSGPNLLALADGFSQLVIYNDSTGTLTPVDETGILLHLDNSYFNDMPVRLYFEGRYRPDGSLDVTFQHVSIAALFADALEWGNTALWSLSVP